MRRASQICVPVINMLLAVILIFFLINKQDFTSVFSKHPLTSQDSTDSQKACKFHRGIQLSNMSLKAWAASSGKVGGGA